MQIGQVVQVEGQSLKWDPYRNVSLVTSAPKIKSTKSKKKTTPASENEVFRNLDKVKENMAAAS